MKLNRSRSSRISISSHNYRHISEKRYKLLFRFVANVASIYDVTDIALTLKLFLQKDFQKHNYLILFRRPYIAGQPCTKCKDSRDTCSNGLCYSTIRNSLP